MGSFNNICIWGTRKHKTERRTAVVGIVIRCMHIFDLHTDLFDRHSQRICRRDNLLGIVGILYDIFNIKLCSRFDFERKIRMCRLSIIFEYYLQILAVFDKPFCRVVCFRYTPDPTAEVLPADDLKIIRYTAQFDLLYRKTVRKIGAYRDESCKCMFTEPGTVIRFDSNLLVFGGEVEIFRLHLCFSGTVIARTYTSAATQYIDRHIFCQNLFLRLKKSYIKFKSRGNIRAVGFICRCGSIFRRTVVGIVIILFAHIGTDIDVVFDLHEFDLLAGSITFIL